MNYDYTRLNVENRPLAMGGVDDNVEVGNNKGHSLSNVSNTVRFFWDGGLLANTPLRQTVIAYRQYWLKVRKVHENLPILRIGIINLHPLKQEYLPSDYDRVVDRKNDIIYHDRTEFDEYVAVLLSDFQLLASSFIKLAEDNGVNKELLQQILQERIKTVNLQTGQPMLYDDLIKARVDVDFVVRLERKNEPHTISNKTFDFTKATIKQLLDEGYEETKPQMKRILSNTKH